MGDPASNIGVNIRRRRTALKLSLDALAERSGVSSTMLSEVERGIKNPTVKLAYQIALALGCSLTDLLEREGTKPVSVLRAADRRTLMDPTTGVVRHGLTSDLFSRQMEVVWYEIPPGSSSGKMGANRPGVVEWLTVIRGEATVVLGEESYPLAQGDALTYGPQTTMEYRNDSTEPCEILLLVDTSQAGR